ncbi:MAG: chromosome segregation protein SMC [Ruminococcaceae bacterium]|nr:chromosome segregation protein SMC [Oscillospiraceae bacterium]
MYLKSLEMQGFKSFPDKTRLVFENEAEVTLLNDGVAHGVTVIVGPNGSGKSNIADAMRWVLGEISSKSLRGSKMEDVIFGGADSRRPMGYAEVSVTFDNRGELSKLDCPYDEVTVTRRYYRSGDSEYFINRKGVRLKDIYELFMNTGVGRDGYSIIGQGKIAEMVSRKSEERRSIFEDASGIAKYRYKKNEAERKLKDTEDNMTRANDIFAEVSAQVGPLEREAEKAKRAIELMDNKKRADVSLWLYDTEKLREELSKAEEAMQHATYDLQIAEDGILALEAQNARLFEASQGSKMESEELLTKIREQTEQCHTLESEHRVAENTIAHAKELIAATQGSVSGTEKAIQSEMEAASKHALRIGELEDAKETLLEKQETLSSEQASLTERASALDAAVAKALEDIRRLENEAVDVKVRMSVLENAKNTDTDKNTSALTELEEYRRISDTLEKQCADKARTVATYDAELAGIDSSLSQKEAEIEEAQTLLSQITERLNNETLRRDSVAQRISTFRQMEEQFEGYSGAVRFVMKQYAEGRITDRYGTPAGTVYGPLSKVISVDDKYLTAIEIALGTNLQNIVVEDEATAKAAMYALKKGEAGRATFFPLTSMRPAAPTKEQNDAAGFEGYIGVADTLVTSDPRFANVLSSLLGRTVVFDNIDHANVMARALHYRVRVVTLDGQQINAGGSFTGGSVRTGGGILSRAGEIKRLEAELTEKDAMLGKLHEQVKKAREHIEELEDAQIGEEDRREMIVVLRNSENGALEQLRAKLEANNTLLEKLRADMREYETARAKYEEDIGMLAAEEKNLRHRIRELSDFRTEKHSDHGDAILRLDEISRALTELYIRISETDKDIETAQTLKNSSEERLEGLNREMLMLSGRINTQTEQIRLTSEAMEANRTAFAAATAQLELLNEKRSAVEKDNFEFERKLNELNAKLRDRMNQKELIFREHTKCEAKLAGLRDTQDKLATKLWDDYELTRNDAVALGYPSVTKENRMEMIALQTECRNKLRVIGHVDLDAVNKYQEVKARYDYMSTQINDLEKAKRELLSIIGQLEGEMKTSFIDSFNRINENFGKVFVELFGGGSAELSLSDPENVLESGIEIKAAPPGKIIKNLMQLSGGEQAFIGVALFFAIIQVNPTPFCILDEIEAALDEVNVERLAQYIKRYAHGTQFIMITHRRGTMAAADRLYGVTMPEHGISKILMLDINDISKKEGEDWNGIFG